MGQFPNDELVNKNGSKQKQKKHIVLPCKISQHKEHIRSPFRSSSVYILYIYVYRYSTQIILQSLKKQKNSLIVQPKPLQPNNGI